MQNKKEGVPLKGQGFKYRWDALSVAGALGLGEAYSKLQEQAN